MNKLKKVPSAIWVVIGSIIASFVCRKEYAFFGSKMMQNGHVQQATWLLSMADVFIALAVVAAAFQVVWWLKNRKQK